MLPTPAYAHEGQPPAPHDLLTSWNIPPALIICLLLLASAYLVGLRRIWGNVGGGRCIKRWQAISYFSGLVTLAVALISPIDALASSLFSVHMVQHLLLILIAGPLLVLGRPLVPLLWALPKPGRKAIGRNWRQARMLRWSWGQLSHPLVSWFIYALVIWVWHLPALYQTALTTPWVHELEHMSMLAAALVFWWVLLHLQGSRRLGHGGALLQIFTTALHTGALGALLSFSQTPLYPIYLAGTSAWGIDLLADQQLAGVIMWIPASFIYLATILLMLLNWFSTIEAQALRHERKIWIQP